MWKRLQDEMVLLFFTPVYCSHFPRLNGKTEHHLWAVRSVVFASKVSDSISISYSSLFVCVLFKSFIWVQLWFALISRYLAKSVTVILPYFPTGTMERVDHEGQIATAKVSLPWWLSLLCAVLTSQTLATQLSCIPLSRKGPVQIVIFDIHALQEGFRALSSDIAGALLLWISCHPQVCDSRSSS
jgi:hypothetical protein